MPPRVAAHADCGPADAVCVKCGAACCRSSLRRRCLPPPPPACVLVYKIASDGFRMRNKNARLQKPPAPGARVRTGHSVLPSCERRRRRACGSWRRSATGCSSRGDARQADPPFDGASPTHTAPRDKHPAGPAVRPKKCAGLRREGPGAVGPALRIPGRCREKVTPAARAVSPVGPRVLCVFS